MKAYLYENFNKKFILPVRQFKNFKKYNDKYVKTFNLQPNEITILAYDALGLYTIYGKITIE